VLALPATPPAAQTISHQQHLHSVRGINRGCITMIGHIAKSFTHVKVEVIDLRYQKEDGGLQPDELFAIKNRVLPVLGRVPT
jgi:hypothetical protein